MQTSIDFSQLGGLYTYQETLDFLQQSYGQVLDALGAGFGNYLILTGCNVVGGACSAGWVIVNGEILPFDGGGIATYCLVYTQTNPEQYADGTQKNIYTVKRVKFTSVASGSTFNFTNLQPLPFNSATLQEALNTVQTLFNDILNIEPAVIISGCIVSAVDTGASTLAIAAGVVLINGVLVDAPAYAGAYPAYLPSSGVYATVAPGAGTYVTFDPYTSQYYLDVLFRNQHQTGDVVMNTQTGTLDSFDVSTGLGKWRWKGWKISDILQSRVPLGYDRRTSSGGDTAWDAFYGTPSAQAGEKTHQLTVDELPAHAHDEMVYDAISNGGPKPVGYLNVQPGGPVDSGTPTAETGGDVAHENRQPFTVILFIEKI